MSIERRGCMRILRKALHNIVVKHRIILSEALGEYYYGKPWVNIITGSPREYYYGKPWVNIITGSPGEYYHRKPWVNILLREALGEYYYGKPWVNIITGSPG
jgi:hypothetical protein